MEWPESRYPFGMTPNSKRQMSYGVMHHDIAEQAHRQVVEQYQSGKLAQINRDDETPER